MQLTAGMMALAAVLTGPVAQGDMPSAAAGVEVSHCVVSLIGEMQVPAKHPGILAELIPLEGDTVLKEDTLARVDDSDATLRMRIAEFEFASAKEQSENAIRIEAAEASEAVAEVNYLKSEEINRKSPGSIPRMELSRLKLDHKHAELQIDLAKHEFEIARITSNAREEEFRLATKQRNDCHITAPWDGVVVERYRRAGEWVQQGEPILRMVQMDKLRVEGFLKLEDFAPLEVDGAEVFVDFQLTRGRTERVKSKISFVSPEVDGGEFRVWAYVDNKLEKNHRGRQQWLLRPGMMAKMTIVLDGEDSSKVAALE